MPARLALWHQSPRLRRAVYIKNVKPRSPDTRKSTILWNRTNRYSAFRTFFTVAKQIKQYIFKSIVHTAMGIEKRTEYPGRGKTGKTCETSGENLFFFKGSLYNFVVKCGAINLTSL